jgi:hypothetical protein
MDQPPTKIITHLTYEELYNTIEKENLILPIAYLNDQRDIDGLINDIIKSFDPVEAISYSAFLNMICQTADSDDLLDINKKELRLSKLTTTSAANKILFHRDNLLYFISRIIEQNVNGTANITGEGNIRYSQLYYKSLLLINSKINREADSNREHNLLKMLIREYPYYYDSTLLYKIYSQRKKRYKFIYNELLFKMPPNEKEKISQEIKAIENKVGISLDEYFHVLDKLFEWFLGFSVIKRSDQAQKLKESTYGFNLNNLDSFYIDKEKFKDDKQFIKFIEGLSKDLPDSRNYFKNIERKDKISNIYKCFQNFFDYPVFKINGSRYCIIDLKFLIEGICSGFLWKLPAKRKYIKDAYGLLLEEYFAFLIQKIFPRIKITRAENNKPDAMLEFEDYIIIFEFTTEYYRFASLYNTDSNSFSEDLSRLLFNTGKNDPMARGKKVKGKFFQLNDYIDQETNINKKIISILVTENYLGDYDLLNRFNKLLERDINRNNLKNLQSNKPLIISLDDLEIFGTMSSRDTAEKTFIKHIESWENIDNKGTFHYNFSFFITSENR